MNPLVARFGAAMAAWNRGDLPGYLELYDPAIRLHGYSPEPMDKAAVSEFYRTVFASLSASGAPSPTVEIFDTIADGRWVACHFTISGQHTGAFLGVPPTGLPYRVTGVTMLRFGEGDTVVERHSSVDMLGFMVEVGAMPAPT